MVTDRSFTLCVCTQPYELKPAKIALDGAALAKLKKGLPVRACLIDESIDCEGWPKSEPRLTP